MAGFLETVLRMFPKKNFFIMERPQEEIVHMKNQLIRIYNRDN